MSSLAGRLAKSFERDLAHAPRVTFEGWKDRGLQAQLLELLVIPLRSQL